MVEGLFPVFEFELSTCIGSSTSKHAENFLRVKLNDASFDHRQPTVTGFMGLHFLFISASQALAFSSCCSLLC